MASEWKEIPLGEAITLQRGFDLPAQERKVGSIPVVSSSGISGYHDEAKVKAPGVVTGRYGTIGEVFLITDDFWPLNTTLYVKDFKGNDERFISYLLRTLNFHSHNDKSSVPGVNRNHLHLIQVSMPKSVEEQKAIAHILGTLDDKIELNRKRNETLEAMARAIFQSWFVDFDPVRAKAAMRREHPRWTDAEVCRAALPTLAPEIAALFPDSFEPSEFGEIPDRWEPRTVEQTAERIAMGPFGSSIKVETFVRDGIPVISGQHLRGFMLDDSTFNFITEKHAACLKKAEVQRGDVVFTHAGSIGQVALIPEDSQFDRYIVSQRQFFMRCNRSIITPEFITFYFGSDHGRHQLLANTSSSGVPSIARPVSYLRSIIIPVPPIEILAEFGRLMKPLLSKYRKNQANIASLTAIRDALLPKLISGELRVGQAQQAMMETGV